MFNGSLQKKSLEISQLLLILSDGRGVFADGVQVYKRYCLVFTPVICDCNFRQLKPTSED